MGLFFNKKKEEVRADTNGISPNIESDVLLSSLLGRTVVTKDTALQIPAVQGCINAIADTISSVPIRLYETDSEGKTKEILGDKRTFLLNNETGDTLTATQFWRAIIEDYFLGIGGYVYINRQFNEILSLHYVDETQISVLKNTDVIFKQYDIMVQGRRYYPYEFLKFLRKTKDGMTSISIQSENPLILSVAYHELDYEERLVKKGGNKRGFLKSEKRLAKDAFEKLKEAFRRLYSNEENVVVLNDGIEFQEASNTSVEMQLNENKRSNTREICKIFGVPEGILTGNATETDRKQFIQKCMSIMNDFECSLDRDLLLESEKDHMYFAFDTKELTRGNIKERYDAYKVALDSGFLQLDEVRQKEDEEPYGINWIKLGLDSVLYDVETKQIYTPNTNAVQDMQNISNPLKEENRAFIGTNLIVTGAPGSGKTSWVNEVKRENDLVIDLDAIKSALWGTSRFHDGLIPDEVNILLKIRDLLYEVVHNNENPFMCYIITTENDPTKLNTLKETLHADLKVMETSKEVCIERVMADESRPNKKVFLDLIEKWFYEGGELNNGG